MKVTKVILIITTFFINTTVIFAQDVELAKQLMDNERFESAEAILEKATAASSNELEASYLLVKTYIEQNKNDEAKKFVDEKLLPGITANSNPMDKIAYVQYLMSINNKAAADKIIAELLDEKKNQKNVSLLMVIAAVQIDADNGDAKLALTLLENAAKRDKNNATIDILKGQAFLKEHDANNAYLSYQEALRKDPKNVNAHYRTGKIFTAQKNTDIYLEHFKKAYELDSNFAPVLEELYNYYYYRDIQLAKKYLVKFIANTDYSLQNDYYMTDILYLNGEYPLAIQSARSILEKQGTASQPRLYKLIAYSFAKSGDSTAALKNLSDYFTKEDPAKLIASDFEFRAQLTESNSATINEAIIYYGIAAEMDSITDNKIKYAIKISNLSKQIGDYSRQAIWLGKLYHWKQTANNVDLFNWGLAHYSAKEYQLTDSVFSIYTTRFPDDIYGYYWRAQASAAIDTAMTDGIAVPFYKEVVEIGETNKEVHKKMLLKSYGYLAGYEANITKNYTASLQWFQKYLEIDPENSDIKKYVAQLEKWITDKK